MRYRALMMMLPLWAGVSSCQPSYYVSDGIVSESYVHRYGMEIPVEEWQEYGESGKVVSTLKNGVTVTKAFAGGVLDGETQYTFPHRENVQKIEHYRDGDLLRDQQFYPSSLVRQERDFTIPGLVTVKTYYNHGQLRSTESFQGERLVQGKYYNLSQNMESGVEEGIGKRTNRDEFGLLESVDQIQDGSLAVRTTFYSNHVPKAHISYQGGVVNGTVKTFMPGGEPKTIEEWSRGVQEGITTEYREGEKAAEIPYAAGAKNGVERRFSEAGQRVVEEVTWRNNIQHGPALHYVNGQVVTDWYFNGQKVTKGAFDRLSGPPMH